jgi:hypothetical protein
VTGWISDSDEAEFLEWLRERGWILNNPVPVEGLKRPAFITQEESTGD